MNKIKSWVLVLARLFSKIYSIVLKHLSFIFQIIWWTAVLYVLIPILVSAQPSFFQTTKPVELSDFILLITAAFVLAYTYQTQKLKEETIYQRKMAVAHDVRFRMASNYFKRNPNDNFFGEFRATESLNNICRVIFLTGGVGADIGRCSIFQKHDHDSQYLTSDYFIESEEGRKAFLNALKLNNGKIEARVLVTNGERFIYTFESATDNWKRVSPENPNLNDQFILIKKELA